LHINNITKQTIIQRHRIIRQNIIRFYIFLQLLISIKRSNIACAC
jgi:hypothetical protein